MPSIGRTSVAIQPATLDALQAIGRALAGRREVNRHLRSARVQGGSLTLQATLDELIRVWHREETRHATHAARRKASRQARRQVAAQLADEDEARWEAEGGASRGVA